MLFLKKGSDTLMVVIHEIYGINNHIHDLCNDLFEKGFDVLCPDLLNRGKAFDVLCPDLLNRGKAFDYKDEDSAYSHFINNIGFESSKNMVMKVLKELGNQYKNRFLIGYSAGASVAWLCGGEEQCCDGIVGYYGSRIRDHIEINPKCPVLLFFPGKEVSFHVDDLIRVLRNKDKTRVYQMSGEHGFSDPYSPKYCNESYEKANQLMFGFIHSICDGK